MKINPKITLAFLLISLVTLGTTSLLAYFNTKKTLIQEVLDHLESVAAIQQNRIESIIDHNLERLALVSSRTQLRLSLESFINDPKSEYQDKINRILLDARSSISNFKDLYVLTLDGKIVASTDKAKIGTKHYDEEFFTRGQIKDNADILFLGTDQSLRVCLSGPLYLEDKLLGVVAIESDMDNIISLIKDYSGLGKTGETLLAKRSNNGDALFIAPVRFDQHAALKRTVSKDNLRSPITQALLKKEQLFTDAVDYDGKPVFAATRYIEKPGWGLVVKINKEEAFAPIVQFRNLLALIVLVSSVIVILASLYIAQSITSPIINLTHLATKISEGDLSRRVEITSRDEIGTLAKAFNQMAENLVEDITARKQAEEALIQAAKQWQDTFDAINDLVAIIDKDCRILRANQAMDKTFAGVKVVGSHCYELFHGTEKPIPNCPTYQSFCSGKITHIELCEPHLHDCWFDIIVYPIKDKNGTVQQVVHIARSVDERKRMEEELHRINRALKTRSECSEALLRATEESVLLNNICRIIVDVGGYRLAWVGFAEQDEEKSVRPVAQAGYEEGYLEIVNITWADTERGRGPTGTAIRTGNPYVVKDILTDPNFTPWRAEALKRGYTSSIALPLLAEKQVIGALNIYAAEPDAFDIDEVRLLTELANDLAYGIMALRIRAERKQAEEEKEKIQAQLLQVQKMEAIGTLAGGVAHDFNNLLTTIQGYTDLALMKVKETDPLYKNLEYIRRASMRAAGLTRQLLLFSRKQPMELTPLNINWTVEDLLKMLNRVIGEDITIHNDIEPKLWTVQADAGNIEQVIMNLVINAKDAMPEGGKLTIKTENVIIDEDHCKDIPEARPGRYVCLSVMDTGVGMNKEVIEHIFEPFFTTKEIGRGTGLGLSIVYGIVKQHQGWTNVYSEPGQGSTFKIYLPALSAKTEDESERKTPIQEFRGKGERILLVEDEEDTRNFVTKVLGESGYIVFGAANVKEAIDIFEKEEGNFHLVFSDVVLPDKTGLQLVDQLLSRKSELMVLLGSGYTDGKSQWLGIQEKGFRFLQKPYTLPELLRAIREAIEPPTQQP
jgi:signal transduction histidine kinase/ActR/RegA family two-component response regulator